jgi:hypothetical protein
MFLIIWLFRATAVTGMTDACAYWCVRIRVHLVILATLVLATGLRGWAQVLDSAAEPVPSPAPAVSPANPFNEERILGVMPDYQTVRDSSHYVAPLTGKQKWELVFKETVDPFNIASGLFTAAESQMENQTPKYGEGWAAYGKRVGAAQADFALQNLFSAGVMANLLHQDPRYYRRGPESKIVPRVAYSLSRLVVARQDSGVAAFNGSNIAGMALGIAASNAYYPSASRNGSVMAGRVLTSLMGGAIGNLMSEFWPDLQQKFFRKNHQK